MKFGQKLKRLIGAVAPTLGTALGGPLGGVAGKVVQEALGVNSEEAALVALETDPEALAKLKSAELDFEKRMAELDVDLEQIHQADRSSARDLSIATNYWPQVALSLVFVIGYFVILGLFFSSDLTMPMNEAFMVMLGVLTAGVPQIMSFWLGSSSGSQSKTAALLSHARK